MRIHVSFIDRVGITQEVLALLGGRNLNLDAVEMVPPNVYIDAPTLSAAVLEELRGALLQVHGVQSVEVVDILPGQRRRLQLDALLAAMPDPVLAVDDRATVLLANPALLDMCNRPPEGLSIAALFADDALGVAGAMIGSSPALYMVLTPDGKKLVTAGHGFDIPPFKSMMDFPVWAEAAPPKGTNYNFPPRRDVEVNVTGSPAPPKIGAQMYAQGTIQKMIAACTQQKRSINDALALAEQEIEGFMRS